MKICIATTLLLLISIGKATTNEVSSNAINISYLNSSTNGVVCLDGSPPAYHHAEGTGEAINNWIVHLEGGIWCRTIEGCVEASKSAQGSSKFMEQMYNFNGILSNEQKINPHFYNWNRVVIRSCDGSSFTGDVEPVDPRTNLHFRGGRIFDAMVDHLVTTKGMDKANYAILSGCSSGGMGSILHCDNFRNFFMNHSIVKCLSDGGYLFEGVRQQTGGLVALDRVGFGRMISIGSFVSDIAETVASSMFIIDALHKIQEQSALHANMTCTNDTVREHRKGPLSSLLEVGVSKSTMGIYIMDTSTIQCEIKDNNLFNDLSHFNQSMENAIDIWSDVGRVRDIEDGCA